MRNLTPTIATSIRNNYRSKGAMIVLLSIALMMVGGLALVFCLLLIEPEMKKELPDRNNLELYLGVLVYATCFIGIGINLNVFTYMPLTREKSRGNVESILATPLSLKEIWLAKSLALFLPGMVVGEVFALITLIVVNLICIVPRLDFIITPWVAISSFLIVPVVYFFSSLLVYLIGLTTKTTTANVYNILFLNIFATLMINLAAHHILDIQSWPFTAANLGIALLVGLTIIMFRSRLNKEKIVLSCKE